MGGSLKPLEVRTYSGDIRPYLILGKPVDPQPGQASLGKKWIDWARFPADFATQAPVKLMAISRLPEPPAPPELQESEQITPLIRQIHHQVVELAKTWRENWLSKKSAISRRST